MASTCSGYSLKLFLIVQAAVDDTAMLAASSTAARAL